MLTDSVQPWHVFVQVALQATVTAFDVAARQALFPRLVPRARLGEAVTLSTTAGRASSLVGPALGGLIIASLGEGAPFLVNGGTFLLLMAAIVGIRGVPPYAAGIPSSFRADLVVGLRYMVATPILGGLLLLELFFAILQMNPVMITIIEGLGVLLSAPAFGALIGRTSLIVVGRVPENRTLRHLLHRALCARPVRRGLQRGVRDRRRGVGPGRVPGLVDHGDPPNRRVMANMGTVSRGVGPLSQTQSGVMAALVGVPGALLLAAGALGVAAGLTARLNPVLWKYTLGGPGTERSAEPVPAPAPVPAPPIRDR